MFAGGETRLRKKACPARVGPPHFLREGWPKAAARARLGEPDPDGGSDVMAPLLRETVETEGGGGDRELSARVRQKVLVSWERSAFERLLSKDHSPQVSTFHSSSFRELLFGD